MMRCIVVDDERLVRELLEDNIRQIPFLELVAVCRNAMEATELLQKEQIDLIFLDIQMPDLNGLQFLRSLTQTPLVILVTAYEQYAMEAFNFQVLDYLLKPFAFDRFLKACNRANEQFHLTHPAANNSTNTPEEFFVHVEYTLVKISVADIEYIEGLKDYIKIHLSSTDKPVLTKMTIKSIEEKLSALPFVRTHKSFFVAYKKITSVKRDFVLIGNKEVPVSDSYKDNLMCLLLPDR
jgi:DNA-binding LytR/AlgR family response regulator